MPSPVRTQLSIWLSTMDIKGSTFDIGGSIWSMREQVKSFEGKYKCGDEKDFDLNVVESIGKYENIFCTEVMQFVYNPLEAMKCLRNSLNPNGKLYLTFHLTHPPMKGHDYLRYTEKGIRKLSELAGLKIEEFIEPIEGYYLVKCTI